MELQNIANLIHKKKFKEAKAGLVELEKIKVKFINNQPNLEDKYENIYFTLSQVCIHLNELKNSKNYLMFHLKIKPNDCEALFNLANLNIKTREIKDVEKIYKKILEIDKNHLPTIANLALFYEGIGKIDKAKKFYKIANEIEPNNLNFHYNLIRLSADHLTDKTIVLIKRLIKEKKILEKEKFLANFILSKNFEKKKKYLNEIKFLELAHSLFLKNNVNKKSHKYWLDIIPYFYNRLVFKSSTKNILKKIKPIFIIGLPRSGSTITELILSTSKTSKQLLGESSLINYSLLNIYGDKFFNKTLQDNFEIDVGMLEEKILSNLENFNISSSNQNILIDKSLENFFYVDLIIKIFPNAKFIVTERNISENIIGIYKKILLDIPWAHSISEIIKYVKKYKIIIDFYKKKYQEKFFIIKLEELQNSNKKKISELFEFCDLDFNDEYFEFQKENHFINNASNIQIRNKLSKNDHNKYKRYMYLLKSYEKDYPWIKYD